MTNLIHFFLMLSPCSSVFSLLLTRPSDHDIYSGKHFEELVAENGTVKQSSVLVLYKPSCDSKLQEYKLSDNLPPDCYVTFLKYDYETTPKYSWYHFDKSEDLYQRYKPKSCLELLYFPVGTPVDEPIRSEVPSGKKISEAIWGLVKVKFSVRNLYGKDIAVRLEVKKKVVSSVILKPMYEEEATAFVTHNLFVTEVGSGKLIYATVIDLTLAGTEIAIDKYIAMNMNEDQYKVEAKSQIDEANNRIFFKLFRVSQKYLLDFKQPAVVPTFTETGYEVQKVPTFLVKELLKYYNRERDDDSNTKRKKPLTTSIAMDNDISQKIDLILRILLEEWADTTLKFTKSSPITEYRNGSVVYGHLQNIATHVIGLLIVLKKDLGDEPDWKFQVIGHDGVRRNLTLDAGEFIIYESATCLLSNPYPFRGNMFTAVSIFYKPDEGWKWKYSDDNKSILYGNEIKEAIHIFATSTMLERSKQKTSKEEL